mmetsp:Transcript_10250/g.19372  ORF Transcript_10250/g.19372 Transcript_10250/m.19372 type:complete len:160 (-) Transcript_10250:377-856(-)|eukprot:CAMPEP_0114238950 /NCGR_PEP_ID=MMETSP0058-20121206/8192_1 /TAXON_ID=36894 /ORGANISM="Pyramimonas parkeae, CCMP726" /LENGTH=159 /DNA_ID=CAMNT_0001351083 /DNA_START=86 /DNA_END=565 /DNA_ORIENTATION=+
MDARHVNLVGVPAKSEQCGTYTQNDVDLLPRRGRSKPAYLQPDLMDPLRPIHAGADALMAGSSVKAPAKTYSLDRPWKPGGRKGAPFPLTSTSCTAPVEQSAAEKMMAKVPNALSTRIVPPPVHRANPFATTDVAGSSDWKCTHNNLPTYHKIYYHQLP